MNGRIIIVGFMGCGKTAVAEALAKRLGCQMIDLDLFITKHEGRSPAEIIQQDGEPAFRKIETRAMRDLFETNDARVIAIGGGAWTIEANRAFINQQDCLSVWLDAPFELCWQRIKSGRTIRPMAPDCESAYQLYLSRRAGYQLAEFTISAGEERSIAEIVTEIQLKVS